MRRSLPVALPLALLFGGALLLLPVGPVFAHGAGAEEALTVEPAAVTAGDTVLLAGSNLEPNDERVLVLKGENIAVDLGTATTDAEGMLSTEVKIPGHLPSGVYQLQAIGDETLEVELQVTAAAGGAAIESPAAGEPAIVARERPTVELAAIVVASLVVGALGVLLVLRAEGVRGPAAG